MKKKITLIGTNHYSMREAWRIIDLLEKIKPDAITIEYNKMSREEVEKIIRDWGFEKFLGWLTQNPSRITYSDVTSVQGILYAMKNNIPVYCIDPLHNLYDNQIVNIVKKHTNFINEIIISPTTNFLREFTQAIQLSKICKIHDNVVHIGGKTHMKRLKKYLKNYYKILTYYL